MSINRHHNLKVIATAADLLVGHAAAGTFDRIEDAHGVWSGGAGGEGGRSSDISRPTETAALAHDQAALDLDTIDRKLRDAARLLGDVLDLAARYAARPAHDGDRAKAGEPPTGCESCLRIEKWSPIEQRRRLATGDLIPVCSWCGNAVRSTGELPPLRKLEAHHRGEHGNRKAA